MCFARKESLKTEKMKLIRRRDGNRTVIGFSNGITVYGKTFFDKYRIETKWDLGLFKTPATTITLYRKDRKPLFKNINIIAFLTILMFPIMTLLTFVGGILRIYYSGFRNFKRDSAYQGNVREFTWMTLAILVLTWVGILILKITR